MDEFKQKYLELQRAFLLQQRQLNGYMLSDVEQQLAALSTPATVTSDTGNGEPPPN